MIDDTRWHFASGLGWTNEETNDDDENENENTK